MKNFKSMLDQILIESETRLDAEVDTVVAGEKGKVVVPGPVAAAGGAAKLSEDELEEGEELVEDDELSEDEVISEDELEESDEVNEELDEAEEFEFKKIDESVFKVKLQEDLGSLMESTELPTEFKTKAVTIFEAAVEARVKAEVANLNAFADKFFSEQVAALYAQVNEQVDAYATYVASEWLKENALAVESGLKVQIAESFLEGIAGLYEAHNMELPEDKVDLYVAVTEENEALKAELSQKLEENKKLQEGITSASKDSIIAESVLGLSNVKADKVKTMLEGVEFTTAEEFKVKVSTILENFKTPSTVKKGTEALLTEGKPETEVAPQLDPLMLSISQAISSQAGFSKR